MENMKRNSFLAPHGKIVKILVIMVIASLSLLLIFNVFACSNKKISTEETATGSSQTSKSSASVEESKTEPTEGSETTGSSPDTSAEIIESPESPTESIVEIPQDIQDLIAAANDYYESGDYGLAKSTYRKAIIAIDDSSLDEQTKQELKGSFNTKYEQVKNLIETAMIHYANAMQLQYEQRYEEAKKELEAAISAYPEYAEAIEAYENLKAIMGLE